jgi:hypothetical protein
MDYKKQYNTLIEGRRRLNRSKNYDGTLENHHIIPKSLGGSNNENNLVLLTPKEHYIAHLLLTEMYEGKDKAKMCYALLKMCQNNPNQTRELSSRRYEKTKLLISENCSGENHPSYGKILWSEEGRKRISDRMTGESNPMYGKKPWNYGLTGITLTEEHKKNISESLIGKEKTKETKLKISESHKGKKKSEEHKRKISETLTGRKRPKDITKKTADKLRGRKQPIIKCPHCDKEGGTTMYRWHFDNCKLKP